MNERISPDCRSCRPFLKKLLFNDARMKTLRRILLIGMMAPIAMFGIWFAVFALNLHFETERKITAALESGFPGAEVSINGRIDWDHAYEICFDVTALPKSSGRPERAIVMVSGGDDGGAWFFGRGRYRSMRECEKSFSRG